MRVLFLSSLYSVTLLAQTPAVPVTPPISSPGFDGQPTDATAPVVLHILSPAPSEVLLSNTADVFLQVDNYILAPGGNRLRVILDNGDPVELDNIHLPAIFRNLEEGGHTVRAVVVRPDGVALTNKEAFAMVYFFVKSRDFQNFINPELPFITVTSPMSGKVQPDSMGRVWIDFRAANVALGNGGTHAIRWTCNNIQNYADKPVFFPGMKPGHYELTIELVTADQQPVPGPMNKVTRVFDVLPVATAAATADSPDAPTSKPAAPAGHPDTSIKGGASGLD